MVETTRTPIFSRYQILEKIGSGGMGTVFKARDVHLDRWVALKVLPPGLQDDVEALERFKREARALARLKHPRVAAVYDAHVERGFPHLVMEYVEGVDLEHVLRARAPLPVSEVIRLGIELAEALEHIHGNDIVHRDVKTSNIIIGSEGQAVLTDFGIAFEASLPRISRGSLGTPEYMSPEQAAGDAIDGRSDLYSLGVVLFECLTGTLPFDRDGEGLVALGEMMRHVAQTPVPSLSASRSDVPGWLETIVRRCLAKEPEDRFASGAELAVALRMAGEAGVDAASRQRDRPRPAGPAPETTAATAPRLRERTGLTLIGHAQPVDAVAFSADSSRLASACEDGLVRIWEVETGTLVHVLEGHEGNVASLAFSPDGRHLVSGDVSGGLRIWDAASGALQRTFDGHSALVMSVAYGPGGRYVVSGGADRAVRIWDDRKGTLVRTAGWHEGYVLATAYSPDGTHVASGGADGQVRVWDAERGKLAHALQGHRAWVMAVAYDPTGTLLASGGADASVRIWHARRGHLLHTLQAHEGWVMGVAFSPSGGYLVSAGRDHALRLWDTASGRLVRTLEGHRGPVVTAAFSPDGRMLASGSSDRTVRVWPLHRRDFRKRWPYKRFVGWLFLAVLVASSLWNEWHAEPEPAAPATFGSVVEEREAPAEPPREARSAPSRRPVRPAPPPPLYSEDPIVTSRGGFTIVVASSRSARLARAAADEYRTRGYRTGIFRVVVDEERLHVVCVGQFPRRGDATEARRRLSRRLPYDAWVLDIDPH